MTKQYPLKHNMVLQILLGMIAGVAVALYSADAGRNVAFLGNLFVSALKAIAPILVFVLITSSLAQRQAGVMAHIRPIFGLYLVGTLIAALVAIAMSFAFPTRLILEQAASQATGPKGLGEILSALLIKMVENPVQALATGNFIGILTWAVLLGLALHHASEHTRKVVHDLAAGISRVVSYAIRLAPVGIFGLVAGSIAQSGLQVLLGYSRLLLVLVSAMLAVALLVNPLMVAILTRRNPYPLVWQCLRNSGLNAFFTRSSAANIPVNLALCKRLGLPELTYSLSIPLGATVNMAGAAVTINILTMAAAHTVGISIDLPTAILLGIVATLSACGTAGVTGGSLLLVPLACSLFGISNDVAMQVVAVGFMIGMVQDSVETALNSSSDVLFTAAVCQSKPSC